MELVFQIPISYSTLVLLDQYQSQSIRYILFGLCLFAAATDILDGYLARKFIQVTESGKNN